MTFWINDFLTSKNKINNNKINNNITEAYVVTLLPLCETVPAESNRKI